MTLTKVVLPEYCSPTSVSSISSFQKSDRNQSSSRDNKASMVAATAAQPRVSPLCPPRRLHSFRFAFPSPRHRLPAAAAVPLWLLASVGHMTAWRAVGQERLPSLRLPPGWPHSGLCRQRCGVTTVED
ncbi:hypothetical protein E2320_014901 [Naja naja]|nr:hypothetical protein E2320_014901 [Naja naja]